MLSKKSIAVAQRIVGSLESVALSPINGTPMDQLTTVVVQGATDSPIEDPVERIHQASMLPTQLGPADTTQPTVSGHDIMSEEYVTLLANSIGEHFRFARQVANPAINAVTSAVIERVGQRAPTHNLSKFYLARIHTNPITAELVGKFGGMTIQEIQLFGSFPTASEAELVEWCRTGSGEFDADLQDLLANLPTGWIEQVYKTYFQTGGFLPTGRDFNLADELLVVHLLALHFDNNPPAGVAMSLVDYNTRITAIAAQAGNTLVDVYRRYDRLILNGALVWKNPPVRDYLESDADGAIVVLGPVYDAFVADGGVPEVIFGAAVTDREGNRDKLLANAQGYIAAYDRFVVRQTRQRNERLSAIAKEIAGAEISKVALQLEQHLPEGTDLGAVQQLVQQQVQILSGDELLTNTYVEVRRALCNSVFAHTDVLKILERLEQYVTKNPELTASKAATYAAISLLVEHQLSQVVAE